MAADAPDKLPPRTGVHRRGHGTLPGIALQGAPEPQESQRGARVQRDGPATPSQAAAEARCRRAGIS